LSVLLAWGFAALFAAAVSLVMIGIAVIVAFWDSHRALAATLVAAAYVGAAVIAGIVLARKIRTKPRMLEGTLRELARDSERLRGGRG
jgi:uncharacterized membrane protein YqjE